MSRIRLVVFDWDGTLVNSIGHIVACIRQSCEELAVDYPGDDAARHIIGLGLEEAIFSLFGKLPATDVDAFVSAYARHFVARKSVLEDFFPGALDVLQTLQRAGFLCAVATGKSRRGMSRALDDLQMQDRFAAVKCADESASKPQPDMLLELQTEFALTAQEMVMVGDTAWDMQMASRAGVPGLGVTWGAHSLERLLACQPRTILNTFTELPAALAAMK